MKQHMKQEQLLGTIAKLIRQDRRGEITPLIIDPAVIERSDLIPDGDIVKTEARILSDALESAANGMYNPEAVAALEQIGPDSPFSGWKGVCLSILDFYGGDKPGALGRLSGIPEESPAMCLVPVIRRLCGEAEGGELSGAAAKLYARVTEDRSFITSAQAQLKECLEADMEELFAETALLLVRDLKASHPVAARKLALWVIRTASLYGFAPELIVSDLKLMFGASEGSRLCALALREDEPEISLLFWIRALIARLRHDGPDEEERAAYLEIIARAADAASRLMMSAGQAAEAGYEEEEWLTYIRSLSLLASALEGRELPDDSPDTVFGYLAGLGGAAAESAVGEVLRPERSEPRERERKAVKPVQLELFA